MTKKTLREHLMEVNTLASYGDTDEDLYETFIECYLSRSKPQPFNETMEDSHRWFDIMEAIKAVDIDDEIRYFKFGYYHMTGDGCAEDMDLDMFGLDDVYEVFPKQVMMTVYE